MNSFRVFGSVVKTFREKYHEDALVEWRNLHDEWMEGDRLAQMERDKEESIS